MTALRDQMLAAAADVRVSAMAGWFVCGCGLRPGTISAALEHVEQTGHVVAVRGEIRPGKTPPRRPWDRGRR